MSKKRNGGSVVPKNINQEVDNNYYFTDYQADYIFDYLSPHLDGFTNPHILDVCANDGVLGKGIFDRYHNATCEFVDIKKHFYIENNQGDLSVTNCIGGRDILKLSDIMKFDIIVCNPPWCPLHLALDIYLKCLSLLSDNGVLFFCINNTFVYQGRDRLPLLKFQKYYLLPRSVFNTTENIKLRIIKIQLDKSLTEEKKKEKIKQQILLDAGFMIYHKNESIMKDAYLLKPVIQVPNKRPHLMLPGFDDIK